MIYFSAPYFIDCISEQDLDELNIEIIRNTLYKVGLAHDNVLSILMTLWLLWIHLNHFFLVIQCIKLTNTVFWKYI